MTGQGVRYGSGLLGFLIGVYLGLGLFGFPAPLRTAIESGAAGIAALKQFAGDGGTIVFLNRSTQLAIDQLGVKARNVVRVSPTRPWSSFVRRPNGSPRMSIWTMVARSGKNCW